VATTGLAGARVVVLGTAWATPLVGRVLTDLGARVVRAENPQRPDPFPLRECLTRGQERIAVDLARAPDRDHLRSTLAGADLLVDSHPPRVLGNAGLGVDVLADAFPRLSVLRIAAFVECAGRGGAADRAPAGRPRPHLVGRRGRAPART
jgi:crotonobetainyl-CoA:carnitine CoA-transferase CaiB-like acyl-CoA transferase